MLSGWFLSPRAKSAHRLARFAGRKVASRARLPFVAANTVYTLADQPVLKSKHPGDRGRILDLPGNLVTTPVTIKGHYRPHSPLERF